MSEISSKAKKLFTIFCTEEEVAAVLGVSTGELDALAAEEGYCNASDMCKKCTAAGRAMLKKSQYQAAMDGDVQMLKALGKQYLGQVDTANEKNEETVGKATVLNVITKSRQSKAEAVRGTAV